MQKIRKRDRERLVLGVCLSRTWGDRKTWEIVRAQDRPDFVVRDPHGHIIGVEVTELLTTGQGKDRSLDGRLNKAVIDVLDEFLERHGGGGALVIGHNDAFPDLSEDLEPFRRDFRSFLARHESPLSLANGKVTDPFIHPWGQIRAIARSTFPGVSLSGDGSGEPLEYMSGRPRQEIESDILSVIERKARQARNYDRSNPLWLIIRNPNQGLPNVSTETLREARRLCDDTFNRVVVLNLPLGTQDPSPPFPHTIDLLAR